MTKSAFAAVTLAHDTHLTRDDFCERFKLARVSLEEILPFVTSANAFAGFRLVNASDDEISFTAANSDLVEAAIDSALEWVQRRIGKALSHSAQRTVDLQTLIGLVELGEVRDLTSAELAEGARLEELLNRDPEVGYDRRDFRDAVAQLQQDAEREYLQRREARLAAREVSAPVTMGRKCVRCRRRDARIDEYCKRCAREAGIVVHGKIV